MRPSSRKPVSADLPRICKWMSLAPARSASRTRFSRTSGAEASEIFPPSIVRIVSKDIKNFARGLLFLFRNEIMQAVLIRHKNAEVIGQFGQMLPDDSFVLENSAGGRLQWLAENEQADDEAGKAGADAPGKSRQPAFTNLLFRCGPAQLPAH